ncbi:hypothetical protein J3458_015221 [Metarhizium acridum]|uniref:Uncharacterized protein n=1 Tax=Metarhizium acridum (strain CQMa 102) TaxID=655827 RepID=E9EI88_METAQ|nr:uncharacterized protein MAC_09586 [Metarhizium acridum CQMa 102]EFY84359.1 hypothetical protein MAC_09586 [Metarhizium acridum CQMa 102]KAG8411927.1 hypothetical protein J3458_015221 [Metarhizium acridum]
MIAKTFIAVLASATTVLGAPYTYDNDQAIVPVQVPEHEIVQSNNGPVANVFAGSDDFSRPHEKPYWPAISNPEEYEEIDGWVLFSEEKLQARIHGNTFWNVKGKLDDRFPVGSFKFDPVTFRLRHPEDYKGRFTGYAGRGQIVLRWEKSGATISGRSPIGDFPIEGESYVDYSP